MDVTTTTLKETISASGTIEPAQEASLSFLTSGTVTAVNVAVVSAVTLADATSGTVTVLSDSGEATQQQVTVGIIGATTVQLSEGVDVGDTVVLADTTEAIPDSTTGTSSMGGMGGMSGMSGGGFTPGGSSGGGMAGPPR